MTERVVLGVDGGGTKTDLCVVDERGDVLAFATGGGANWEGIGVEAVGACLGGLAQQALAQANLGPSDVAGAAFCLAGVDWPSDQARLAPALDGVGLGGVRVLTNDSFAALRAGTAAGFGCVSIAGTGGVTAGRNPAGAVARTMGIAIGEGAGAWGLVAEALGALVRAHNRSGEPTALSERFLAATGCTDVEALFEGISRGTVHVGGALSVEVLDASRAGDPVAQGICHSCGDQHGRDARGVATQLGFDGPHSGPFDVVLAGGVHVNGEAEFRRGFSEALYAGFPAAVLRPLAAPPVAGAALLALELIGVPVEQLHDRLCEAAGAARAEVVPA